MNTEDSGLALRRPDVPIDINDLAARKGEAIEIIEARAQVLSTVRKFAIIATWPQDWLLFKSPAEQGGQVVGYLQDCGADRLRDLYGIEIFDIGRPEKVETNDPGVFQYRIVGSGRCKLTKQTLVDVEGGRSSTDDFCKGKAGAELDLAVRKAARANLDGNITRELSGLKSVPVEELTAVWAGTTKTIEQCRRGRGFGTRDERLGAERVDAGIPAPKCNICGAEMVLRNGSRGRFYSCAKNRDADHKDHRVVDFEDWKKKIAAAPPAAAASAQQRPPDRVKEDLKADDVFGGGNKTNQPRRQREPGEEG